MPQEPYPQDSMQDAAPYALLRPEHLYKAVGLAFVLALVFRFFPQISRGLLLLYAAAIVAVLFNSVVRRFPVQRKWMTAALGIVIMVTIVGLLWIGVPALLGQFRNVAAQAPQVEVLLGEAEAWIHANTGLTVELVGADVQGFLREAFLTASGGGVIGRAGGLLEIFLVPLLIVFGGLFAVGKPNDRLLSPVLRVAPRDLRPSFRRILELLGIRLMGWLKGTLIAMFAVGALSVAAFSLIGVPNALLLGLLSGVTEFIPLVGPWIGGSVATVVAFLDEPQKAIWTGIAATVIQHLESNLITPWAMSRTAQLHPFVTLFALVFFGSLFGFLGILLSIPLTLFFWTVIEVLWVERALDTGDDRIAPVVEE